MIEIVQKRFCKPTQILRLTDDDWLEVEIKRFLSEKKVRLKLQNFNEISSHQKAFQKRPFVLTVIFGVLTIVLLVLALMQQNHSEQIRLFETTGVWFSCFVLSGLALYFTRKDYILYVNRFNNVAMITPYFNLPDETSFQNFITALDSKLKSIHNPERIGFH